MLLRRIVRRLLVRSTSSARANWLKLLAALVVLGALPALAYWRGLEGRTAGLSGDTREMVVERLEPASNKINLVLKEKSGPRRLVLAVGQTEASSIVQDLNLPYRVEPVTAYAMTNSIADVLGGKIQRVVVSNVSGNAYFAKVILLAGDHEVAVDAAPSDAIALAVRAKAPIYADATVLDKAGIVTNTGR